MAMCVKPGFFFFTGRYLEKVAEDSSKVFFKLSSASAKFYSESVFSTVLSLSEEFNGNLAIYKIKSNDYICYVNNML